MVLMVLLRVALVLLLPGSGGGADVGYQEFDDDDDAAAKFYDKYRAEELVTQPLWSAPAPPGSAARVRRYEDRSSLSQDELQGVRGALSRLLSGRRIDSEPGPSPRTSAPGLPAPEDEAYYVATMHRSKAQHNFEGFEEFFGGAVPPTAARAELVEALPATEEQYAVKMIRPSRSSRPAPAPARYAARHGGYTIAFSLHTLGQDYYELLRRGGATNNDTTSTTEGTSTPSTTTEPEWKCVRRTRNTTAKPTSGQSTCAIIKSSYLDVVALLNIISNLTYDYETNLTDWVNETLWKWSIPTCPTPTTTSTPTTTTAFGYDYESNGTGVVMGKCYVCGLEVEEIPRRAHCADAFAGDFLPLVPVDPVARGQIGLYRKYCRYMDVPHYHYNLSDPRVMWGRWTGGCSVRWIDLSGVYTQRSCRNRFKPVLGRHFVSKRMAKLESALMWVDNGCVISPAASLVPLSRGISLYARFHACVCTGSWCNHAARLEHVQHVALALALLHTCTAYVYF